MAALRVSVAFIILVSHLHVTLSLKSAFIRIASSDWQNGKDRNAVRDSERIIQAALSSNTSYERLAYMTDTFGPRFSGSVALEKAINWTKEEMIKDGLDVEEEPVEIPCWVRGNEYAKLISPRQKNVQIAGLGGSVGTPNGNSLTAKLLVVSSFDELEERQSEANGTIVVYNVEFEGYFSNRDIRHYGAQMAQRYGAVAALLRSITQYGLQTVHTGATYTASVPIAAITIEDSKMFARMQARGQEMVLELYMEAHTLPNTLSRNLIVELKGYERPEEVVVFGGHTDSWDITDGAIDDGGGTIVTWEVMTLLHSLGLRARRTIRAVFFVNEENGSRGGQQYLSNRLDEVNLTSFAIETDEGNFTPYGISFYGSDKAKAILEELGEELLGGLGAGNVTGDEYGTDISYLCDEGVPCSSLKVLDPRLGNYPSNPCLGYSNPPYPEPDVATSGYFWYHHTKLIQLIRWHLSSSNNLLQL